ncbi:MAG: hypothetical protein ABW321_13210 [Polyangiales bacterium]
MTQQTQHTQLACRCGSVELALDKAPILSAECHCTSCRTAGEALQALPGMQPLLEPNGGTGFVLYRKDRIQFVKGAALLKEHRLTTRSKTRRVVASCCNTPVFLEFESGHWLSLYSRLWPEQARPAIELRTMTMDRTDTSALANDVPNAKRQSLSFFAKLLRAWVAMGFRVPKIPVGNVPLVA